MPDDKTIRHPHDGKRIDINDPQEVRNWRNVFNCTEEELIDCVNVVGTSSTAVRQCLKK